MGLWFGFGFRFGLRLLDRLLLLLEALVHGFCHFLHDALVELGILKEFGECIHLLRVAFHGNFLKRFWEDVLCKHVGIGILGLFAQLASSFLHPVEDGFNNHTIRFRELAGIHEVDFINDIRQQVSLGFLLITLSAFLGVDSLFLFGW